MDPIHYEQLAIRTLGELSGPIITHLCSERCRIEFYHGRVVPTRALGVKGVGTRPECTVRVTVPLPQGQFKRFYYVYTRLGVSGSRWERIIMRLSIPVGQSFAKASQLFAEIAFTVQTNPMCSIRVHCTHVPKIPCSVQRCFRNAVVTTIWNIRQARLLVMV